MKFLVTLPPCIRCLASCRHCQYLPRDKRVRQAKAALKLLKAMFPGLAPEGEGKTDH